MHEVATDDTRLSAVFQVVVHRRPVAAKILMTFLMGVARTTRFVRIIIVPESRMINYIQHNNNDHHLHCDFIQ